MRRRLVSVVAWWVGRWPRAKTAVVRLVSFSGGLLILHREIYEVNSAEPLLVFLGLWLCGVAPAQFFDGLKNVGQRARGELDHATDDTPKAPRKKKLKSVENEAGR